MEKLYPLMFKLTGKNVVIIGGGRVALRKAQGLQPSGVQVTVVSPDILPELLALPNITWRQKRFEAQDIERAHLIYAATDSREVNQAVADAVADWQWFNDTAAPTNSNFYTPAVIRAPELILSVSTAGRDPALAKRIKQRLMAFLNIEDNTVS